MPKPRKSADSRKCEKKIYILCEGEKDHSEYAYLKGILKKYPIKGNRVDISLVYTQKNTGKELVEEASKKIEKQFKDIDQAWVVYDKDGYTKHKETFDSAERKKVKIAFSSIAFEFWILLHFEYTTRPFEKSDDIISYMKKYIDYKKSAKDIFAKTENKLKDAINNAKRIRDYKKTTEYVSKPYELNPYTDLDILICEILKEAEK